MVFLYPIRSRIGSKSIVPHSLPIHTTEFMMLLRSVGRIMAPLGCLTPNWFSQDGRACSDPNEPTSLRSYQRLPAWKEGMTHMPNSTLPALKAMQQ